MSLLSNIGSALKNFGSSVSNGCKNFFSGVSEKAAPVFKGITEVVKSSFSKEAIAGSVQGLASGGWVGAIVGGVQGTTQNLAQKYAAEQRQATADEQAAAEQAAWEAEQARRVMSGGSIAPRSVEYTGVNVSANVGAGGVSGINAEPVKNETLASKWERYRIFTRIIKSWGRG